MELTGNENPFLSGTMNCFEICQQYDVTLSLGDACRPGSIEDASDVSQIEGARNSRRTDDEGVGKKDVQVIIEGPGHMPLNQIQANMEIQKTICKRCAVLCTGTARDGCCTGI